MGSADLMPRNLNRRIEVLFPILDKEIRTQIISTILPIHLRDTTKKRILKPDGTYVRVIPHMEDDKINAQEWLITHKGIWNEHQVDEEKIIRKHPADI